MRRNKQVWRAASILALMVGATSFIHAQHSLLQIYPAAKGQVVRPGQTLVISVAADSSVQKLALIGQQPIGMARLASGGEAGMVGQGLGADHPVDFEVTIPSGTEPGIYRLTAVGRTASNSFASEQEDLDVERPTEPLRIWVEPSILVAHTGDQIPLRVLGAFADGSQTELTRSTKTAFASADPSVASITEDGRVTAVREGRTSIRVRTPSRDYSIPVRVQQGP